MNSCEAITQPFRGDAWRLMHRNMGAAHGDVLLSPDLGIVEGPALARVVEKDNPKQVKFSAVIDQNMGVAIAFGGNDRD